MGDAALGRYEVVKPAGRSVRARKCVVPVKRHVFRSRVRWTILNRSGRSNGTLEWWKLETFPFFMSDRMNFTAAITQPIYGWDFTSFQLK